MMAVFTLRGAPRCPIPFVPGVVFSLVFSLNLLVELAALFLFRVDFIELLQIRSVFVTRHIGSRHAHRLLTFPGFVAGISGQASNSAKPCHGKQSKPDSTASCGKSDAPDCQICCSAGRGTSGACFAGSCFQNSPCLGYDCISDVSELLFCRFRARHGALCSPFPWCRWPCLRRCHPSLRLN